MTAPSQAILPDKPESSGPTGNLGIFQKAFGWFGAAVTFFIALILFWEWIRIGIISDPSEIAGYYFGSEAMIDKGGWHYQSASIYAWTCFAEGILYICASSLLIHSTINKHSRRIFFIFAILVLVVAYSWLDIVL